LALIASAHVAVAAQGARFGLVDIREGRCDPRIMDAVSAAIGERRTRELALTGRIFSTPEALAWGLVHAITPVFELEERAVAIATALANANAAAVRMALGKK
jgi:enoyl-CoA hydratase/carnithine racemase